MLNHKVGDLVYHGVDQTLGIIRKKYHPEDGVYDKRTYFYEVDWVDVPGHYINRYSKYDIQIFKDSLKEYLKNARESQSGRSGVL